jgi:hypothetical protein
MRVAIFLGLAVAAALAIAIVPDVAQAGFPWVEGS